MPESRYRFVPHIDVAAVFARRRAEVSGKLQDDPEIQSAIFGSPLLQPQVITSSMTAPMGAMGSTPSRLGRGSVTRAGNAGVGNVYGTPAVERGNLTVVGSAQRETNSVLPSSYPRVPLPPDITPVMRDIERRRARLREVGGRQFESPLPQRQMVFDSGSLSGAHLEHEVSKFTTPTPTAGRKRFPPSSVGKVPKILRDITNQIRIPGDHPEILTPQKKLLNSLDTVEKVVMEELQKLKRTPSAKKAERGNKDWRIDHYLMTGKQET